MREVTRKEAVFFCRLRGLQPVQLPYTEASSRRSINALAKSFVDGLQHSCGDAGRHGGRAGNRHRLPKATARVPASSAGECVQGSPHGAVSRNSQDALPATCC
ncbi:hypothetical protein Vafri_22166 [Volvox africanus]|nr:hypothetical protein Vafri_22166 [Volvox africanus]